MAWLFITAREGVARRHTSLVHDGWATFRNSAAARWLVVTPTHDATGLKPNLAPSLSGPFDMGLAELDVVLRGGRTVRGRVTDTAGRPVAGVELHVTVDWRIGTFKQPQTIFVTDAHTDADGRFVLAGLPDEEVKVYVWQLPLGWTKPKPVHLGPDVTTWNLQLEPAERATIRVVIGAAPRCARPVSAGYPGARAGRTKTSRTSAPTTAGMPSSGTSVRTSRST